MKSTGIIRKVDDLGRVVIPMELRNKLNIKEKDSIEIYTEGPAIILKKYKTQICQYCEARIEEEDKFCRNCGKKV